MPTDPHPPAAPSSFPRTLTTAPAQPRQTVVCASNGQFHSYVNPQKIDELIGQADTFLWLDLQNPQDHEIDLLRDEFKFHPLAIEDATKHHERPKVESYENYYFLVFYAISYDEKKNRLLTEAMNLFIGANYLVSVHQGEV